MSDPYALNRLLQELMSDPHNLAALKADRAALYDRYELSAEQRAALDAGGPEALGAVGAHPILQMHYLLAADPGAASFISVEAYKDLAGGPRG